MDWWSYDGIIKTNNKKQLLQIAYSGTLKTKARKSEWHSPDSIPLDVEWKCDKPDRVSEYTNKRWDWDIIDHRLSKRKQQYLVKTTYYDINGCIDHEKWDEKWEPAKNLCRKLIDRYTKKGTVIEEDGGHLPMCPYWTESSDTDSDCPSYIGCRDY